MKLCCNVNNSTLNGLILIFIILIQSAATLADNDMVVVLVRHAEKAKSQDSVNPGLSPAGLQRAQQLVSVLEHTSIKTIITTPLKRTVLTAQPLAEHLEIEPYQISVNEGLTKHVQAVAKAVSDTKTPGGVLIVGHSNTIPRIISALGGPELADLCESAYDQLFILVMDSNEKKSKQGVWPVRFIQARYGAVSKVSEGCSRTRADVPNPP